MKTSRTPDAPPATAAVSAGSALRFRLEDLIGLGEKGELRDSPETLAALFTAVALLLGGEHAGRARKLADGYDAEALAWRS